MFELRERESMWVESLDDLEEDARDRMGSREGGEDRIDLTKIYCDRKSQKQFHRPVRAGEFQRRA